jgi:hypothetical protein
MTSGARNYKWKSGEETHDGVRLILTFFFRWINTGGFFRRTIQTAIPPYNRLQKTANHNYTFEEKIRKRAAFSKNEWVNRSSPI